MSEHSVHHDSLPPAPVRPDLASLIIKMQKQLDYLEKKIDILVNQSSGRSFREQRYSKPFRSFGPSQRHSKGEHGQGFRDRDSEQGHRYEKQPGEPQQWTGQKKKPFYQKRRDRG